jgi:hypothetical protein
MASESQENPTWTPRGTNWGVHLRIFNGSEERHVANYVRTTFITAHRLFTSADFRDLVCDCHLQKYAESENPPDFNCTSSFVCEFMTRNGFSLRKQHFECRPSISPEQIDAWMVWLSELLQNHENHLILNCDKTSWKLCPNNILTWWETGAEDI